MSGDHVPGPGVQDAGQWYQDALNDEDPAAAMFWWAEANSYHVIAHRDEHRRPGEPPSHIFTGPTGTNVNDLLIAWRV
jgi:glycerate-2-kinase